MKIEKRFFNADELELRAYSEDENMFIEGYAARYNVESLLLHENGKRFIEVIEPGAFTDVIENDVYLTFNHSPDKVLARTTNKTLELRNDDKGLFFKAKLNNTTISKDLYEMVSRGDVFENSFAFQVNDGQSWSRNDKGVPLRRISRISALKDVSVVTKAAYPQTSVWARGFEEFENEPKPIIINKEPHEDLAYILKIKKLK